MAQVSYFESINAQPVTKDADAVFAEFVTAPTLEQITEQYRANPDGALKRRFPSVTWSGVFSGSRTTKNMKSHSGLVCLDFDHLDDIQSSFDIATRDVHTRFAFISPSGAGLKVVCEVLPVPTTTRLHKRAYVRVSDYFGGLLGAEADATNDITRLCFLCTDTAGHSNPLSPPLIWGPTAKAEQLIEQLDAIVDDADEYETWIKVGQALHSDANLDSHVAFALWDGWSRKASNYQSGVCALKWKSFDASRENGVGVGTIAYLARQSGWEPRNDAGLEYIPDGRTLAEILPQLGIEMRQNVRDLSIQLRRLNAPDWNGTLFPYDASDADGEDAWRGMTSPVSANLRGEIASKFVTEKGNELTYSDTGFWDSVNFVVSSNQVDPFLLWLERLDAWDGVERLAMLWESVFSTVESGSELYLDETITKLLVGAVRRSYEPGTPHDWMPVVVGPQGCGKSLFIRSLLPQQRGWFSDSPSIEMPTKEQLETIGSAVLVEYPEVSATRPTLAEQIKAHLSRTEDQVRKAYAREPQNVLRRWVAVGTANDIGVGILPNDPSGSRRFAVVKVGAKVNGLELVKHMDGIRNQLWSEAVQYYRDGMPNLLSVEAIDEAAKANQLFESRDDHMSLILTRLDAENKIEGCTIAEIAAEAGLYQAEFESGTIPMRLQFQMGRELSALGYAKRQDTVDGVRARRWYKELV